VSNCMPVSKVRLSAGLTHAPDGKRMSISVTTAHLSFGREGKGVSGQSGAAQIESAAQAQ
jgi:hypothetical protein